jgi:homoserine kinase
LERLEAAKLAEKNYPQWRALLLAVDFKGATVVVHQEINAGSGGN